VKPAAHCYESARARPLPGLPAWAAPPEKLPPDDLSTPDVRSMKIVAGNSNCTLAQAIAGYLSFDLAACAVKRFADQEIFVEIQENVRGEDVFVVQSTSFPVNDHLMELLIIIDALLGESISRTALEKSVSSLFD
jgi:hypothetical protein